MKKFALFFVISLTLLAFSFFFSTSQASAQCTTFVSGDGSPPCDTPQFKNPGDPQSGATANNPCVVANFQPPFPNNNVTGSYCAGYYNLDCRQTYTTFGWYAESCIRPTPTPTPFQCVAQYGIYFSCYAGGCPQNWVPASQNPDTSCGSSMSCCWYNPPPAPTSAPTPTTPPSCVQQPGSFAWSDCDTSRCSYSINYWYNCDGTTYQSGGQTDYGCSWTCASAPTPTTPPPGFTPPPATPTPTTSVTSSCANPPPGLVETSGGWGYTCSANYCSGSGSPADACASSVYQCLGGSWQYKWPQCGIDVNSDGSAEYPCRGCSVSMPSPTPTVVPYDQPCGSCGGDCPGDSSKSWCFDGLTYSCQEKAKCFINSNNICMYDPTNCTSAPPGGGGSVCMECTFNMGRSCQPKTAFVNGVVSGGECKNLWPYRTPWGPKYDIMKHNIDDCNWLDSQDGSCKVWPENFGVASVDMSNCVCNQGIARPQLTFSNNSPSIGQTVTVKLMSFKEYDVDTTGTEFGAYRPPLYLTATDPATGGLIPYGRPIRKSTYQFKGYNTAPTPTWTPRDPGAGDDSCSRDNWAPVPDIDHPSGYYTQYIYEWDVTLPRAGTYNFRFYVDQINYTCSQSSLTVSGPTPTPLPGFMQIIGGDVYSNE